MSLRIERRVCGICILKRIEKYDQESLLYVFCLCLPAGTDGVYVKGKGSFKNLAVDEFDRYIQNEEVQRVDVRTVAEYSKGHIPNSLNINVMDDSFAAEADELLDKERPVAVYCRSGKRSREAARILTKKGFKVVNLDKGFEHWKEFGKEVCY